LIGRNLKFLLPLINNKWPPRFFQVAIILRIKILPEYLYQ
jgi:hypothetical protein